MAMTQLLKPEALSQISRDIGQVFFASVFVEPFLRGSINMVLATSGLVLAMIFWLASIILHQNYKQNY